MSKRVRLGMVTPSSNTVLEPVTAAMVSDLPEVSVHFARFPVTEISLGDAALRQFDEAPMIAAARLLADARVDIIGWNGTSASWLGLARDEALCRSIKSATGIAAITSVLALVEVLRATGVTRLGLVTPYLPDVQRRIIDNFAANGIEIVAERHSGVADNYSFAEIGGGDIAAMVRAVAASRPQAITTLCTNLAAAPLVAPLEAEVGIPIRDSIGVIVWKALKTTGIDPRRVTGWGRLFGDLP
jgi:maleate isomerase